MIPTDSSKTSTKKPSRRVNPAAFFFFGLTLILAAAALWNAFLNKQPDATTDIHAIDTGKLSAEQFAAYKEKYLTLLVESTPRETLAALREEVSNDATLARACHPLAHEIGRATYNTTHDFTESLAQQDEICNSGFLHGVIEAHFSESEDVLAEIPETCKDFDQESYLGWQCLHGIGHGLMYFTAQDLPRSLALCDELPLAARSTCANGVFMDNFNTDQVLHPSRFLKADDPSYPCAEQQDRHKSDCYTYAPTYYLALNPGEYDSALDWCRSVEKEFASSCFWGVGSQTIKENSKTPEFAIEICEKGAPAETDACIKGALNLLALHHGSIEPVETLCATLPEHRASCKTSLEELTRLFSEK
jgi:hypothetical protein